MAVKQTQPYPRITDLESKDLGLLDTSKLKAIPNGKIDIQILRTLAKEAIEAANLKTQQAVQELDVVNPNKEELKEIKASAKALFEYFKRPDPAFMANYLMDKSYAEVAEEFYAKREVHRSSMNAGWRYQFLILKCAEASNRLLGVSDLNVGDADITWIGLDENGNESVAFFISVKNRKDTVSGTKIKGMVADLEKLAKLDKNKRLPYCGIIAYGMQKGAIRQNPKESSNIEYWPSDFLWPFVSGYSYSEIIDVVSEALKGNEIKVVMSENVKAQFRFFCDKHDLLDANGVFSNKNAIIKCFTT